MVQTQSVQTGRVPRDTVRTDGVQTESVQTDNPYLVLIKPPVNKVHQTRILKGFGVLTQILI